MPVEDDCVLLDLSRMTRILEMDAELGLITLEPGVTQGQLFQFLKDGGHDFFVPTTGAGPPRVCVICYAPIIPWKESTIARMVAAIQKTLRQYGFPEAISLTTVNERCAMGVIPIIYKRPDDKDNAHRCFETLLEQGRKEGCFPYRLNVAAMENLPREGDSFWHLAKILKDAADPDHLFSPGRCGL